MTGFAQIVPFKARTYHQDLRHSADFLHLPLMVSLFIDKSDSSPLSRPVRLSDPKGNIKIRSHKAAIVSV